MRSFTTLLLASILLASFAAACGDVEEEDAPQAAIPETPNAIPNPGPEDPDLVYDSPKLGSEETFEGSLTAGDTDRIILSSDEVHYFARVEARSASGRELRLTYEPVRTLLQAQGSSAAMEIGLGTHRPYEQPPVETVLTLSSPEGLAEEYTVTIKRYHRSTGTTDPLVNRSLPSTIELAQGTYSWFSLPNALELWPPPQEKAVSEFGFLLARFDSEVGSALHKGDFDSSYFEPLASEKNHVAFASFGGLDYGSFVTNWGVYHPEFREGTVQLEAFQLLYTSPDTQQAIFGSSALNPPGDYFFSGADLFPPGADLQNARITFVLPAHQRLVVAAHMKGYNPDAFHLEDDTHVVHAYAQGGGRAWEFTGGESDTTVSFSIIESCKEDPQGRVNNEICPLGNFFMLAQAVAP